MLKISCLICLLKSNIDKVKLYPKKSTKKYNIFKTKKGLNYGNFMNRVSLIHVPSLSLVRYGNGSPL